MKRIEIQEVDSHSSRQHGTSISACGNGAGSVENEHLQITVGLHTGKPTNVKEQNGEGLCKVTTVENSKAKPAYEKQNCASQTTVTNRPTQVVSSEEVPPIPKTSVQFLTAWKKVRTNSHLCYLYLKVRH